jgi:hypothetical protein
MAATYQLFPSTSPLLALAHECSSLRFVVSRVVEWTRDEFSQQWPSIGRLDRTAWAAVGIVPDHRFELGRKLTRPPSHFELRQIIGIGDEPLTYFPYSTVALLGTPLGLPGPPRRSPLMSRAIDYLTISFSVGLGKRRTGVRPRSARTDSDNANGRPGSPPLV